MSENDNQVRSRTKHVGTSSRPPALLRLLRTEWTGCLFLTVILLGMICGGLLAWYGFAAGIGGVVFGALVGGVLGVVLAMLGVAFGLKEPIAGIGEYLAVLLVFVWFYLWIGLLALGEASLGAVACIGPVFLFGLFLALSMRKDLFTIIRNMWLARTSDKPRLVNYFEQINAILAAGYPIDGDARDEMTRLTLVILPDLVRSSKGKIVTFLYQKELIIAGEPIVELRGADLRELVMIHKELNKIRLDGAVLSRASLQGSEFRGASLQGCDLREADMSYAKLEQADLSGADLRGAILDHAELSGAIVTRQQLSEAQVAGR